MESSPTVIQLDIAVIGGGIAGLWLLNRLQREGYNCALFESGALGRDQSVASQGMIHGGIKYTLSGALTGASEAIADMPDHWKRCLKGEGDVDLSGAEVLSDHFYMWSSASVTSRLTTFFASKATRGRVDKVTAGERPAIFQNSQFSGKLYRLVDMVLDVPSVVRALADNIPGRTYLLPVEDQSWSTDAEGNCVLRFARDGRDYEIRASRFIFTAGKGNGVILGALGAEQPQMQIRPLQQVMVKHDQPFAFYGHCLGADKTPRLTISSHRASDGQWVWYLGGSLAEKGADQTAAEVIAAAKQEMNKLIPWLDLSKAQWAALPVDRAEPRQKNLVRPDKAYVGAVGGCHNALVAWPTKLTLAPNLASETVEMLQRDGVSRSGTSALELPLPQAGVAQTPWDAAFASGEK